MQEAIQEDIIADFELFDDWTDKYEHLIDFAKELKPFDEKDKKDEHLVRGCQSKVWLTARVEDGKIFYAADSDALITKGIAGLLIKILSGRSPEEVLSAELYALERIGLKEHLSPNRANGLASMIKMMKSYAQVLS